MKINPFKPNSPTRPGMFAGRGYEISKIEIALLQTRSNQNQNFLLLGERGIGKTSLMNLIKFQAEGYIDAEGVKLNFLVIDIDISKDTTQLSLIKKIELALRRKLAKTEPEKKLFSDIWNFLSSFEAAGFKFNKEKKENSETLFEEFSYSIADTLNRITNGYSNDFDAKYDGILILIDEVDNASPQLDIGSFVKLLTERMQKEGSEKLMFGLAGLNKSKQILIESHPSSIRIFEELNLDRLTDEDVEYVIEKVLNLSKELNGFETNITTTAKNKLITLSEGFPHFIHQYGFCAFNLSDGKNITEDNVLIGAFGKNGAIELIGNKYYRDDYYNKIKVDRYRQVLIIMADHLDSWVTKKQIKEQFKGNEATLKNAISALVSRNIIVTKEGTRGTYKLQDKGFALWIKLNQKKEELAA